MDSNTQNPPRDKLLIAEDDFYILDLYKIEGKAKGFEVYTATDGTQALALARVSHPDVVLLDVMLPNLNGIDVLKKLRSDPVFQNLPVIMFTNVSEDQVRQEAAQAGANGFMLKAEHTPSEIVGEARRLVDQRLPASIPPNPGSPF